MGRFELLPDDADEAFVFEENVVGDRIPKEYIPSVEKGFRSSMSKGPLAEYPIVGVKAILEDGSYHDVDSSDMAFRTAARGCFRETFLKMKPVLLEPVMAITTGWRGGSDPRGRIPGRLLPAWTRTVPPHHATVRRRLP